MISFSHFISRVEPSPTLAASARANALKAQGRDIVSFTVGEPDFDTPEHVKEACRDALKKGYTKYTPSNGILPLREAIVAKTKRDLGLSYTPGETIVTNGGKQGLATAFAAVLNPGDEVIIPTPYWTSYPDMVKMAGGNPVFVETEATNGYVMTGAALTEHVTPRTKAIVINSPSNPTGGCYSRAQLQEIVDAFRGLKNAKEILIISDEVYEYMTYDNFEFVSIAALAPDLRDNILIINAFSKSYAMTGWRVGFAHGPKALIDVMNNHQSQFTSGVCSIAQWGALAAPSDNGEFPRRMMEEFTKRRQRACEVVESISGLNLPFRPQGAFYLFIGVEGLVGKKAEGKPIKSGADFAAYLLEKYDVAVVSGDAFGVPNAFRISFALSMDSLNKGLDRIKSAVESLQ